MFDRFENTFTSAVPHTSSKAYSDYLNFETSKLLRKLTYYVKARFKDKNKLPAVPNNIIFFMFIILCFIDSLISEVILCTDRKP